MNKEFILGLLTLAIVHSTVQAQSRRPSLRPTDRRIYKLMPPPTSTDAPTSATPPTTAPATNRRVQAPSPPSFGQLIGQTTYDLQTNRSTGNRMAMTNNALSAVWTQNCMIGGGPLFPNRGVGYNYAANATGPGPTTFVNGTPGNCGAGFGTFGISNTRVGWPEIVHSNNHEVVVAHTPTLGLSQMTRPFGASSWTQTALPFTLNIDGPGQPATAGFWPRMVASGNTVHLLYCDNPLVALTPASPPQAPIAQPSAVAQPTGVVRPLLYARSLDGGASWDKANIVLPMFDYAGIGSGALLPGGAANDTVQLEPDSYVVAANGNHVAVCITALGRNVVLAKSADGGTTWSSRLIMGNYTDNDTVNVRTINGPVTSIEGSDGSMSMVIDNGGTVHWFSGIAVTPVRKRTGSPYWSGTGRYFENSSQNLLYWNDRELASSKPTVIDSLDTSCPSFPFPSCLLAEGEAAYQAIGVVSMPTATVDTATGDVYVIYSGGRIGTSNDGTLDGQFHRDLYVKKLEFAGGQIKSFASQNISRDLRGIPDGAAAQNTEESVYPSAVHTLQNNFIHYQWMADFEPGTALQGTPVDAEVENAIGYDRLDVTAVNWRTPVIVTPTAVVTATAADVATTVADASVAPNPTTGISTLSLTLKQAANATVIVRNPLGQEVLRVPAGNLHTGLNTINLDLSGQAAGVYFYTVSADSFLLTRRVVKH